MEIQQQSRANPLWRMIDQSGSHIYGAMPLHNCTIHTWDRIKDQT
jgi:hypothetical protein